jgi:RimJ/RimL family protein N-acetyltransferase
MSDVDDYHKHINTEAVMAYLGGVMSKRDVKREVRWLRRQQTEDGHTFWAVERKRDGMLLGFCGVVRVREPDTPVAGNLEIGWRLRADAWRRGFGTEAAEAVIDWLEWERPGELLVARVHRDNAASQALARKLGMRRAKAIEARLSAAERELLVFRRQL